MVQRGKHRICPKDLRGGSNMGDVKVEDRVKELADEFGVSEQVVWSLYDMMPGELYDGIVTELEDAQHDRFYEDLFED